MPPVIVVIGPGQIGQAIARRVGVTATYWYGELAEVRERMIAKPSRS
jgi:predicted dinucleotide-binding enzyme